MRYESSEPLPKTMQAVVCHGPEDYRLEERDVPEPGPGEVIISVSSVGICASDIACYLGTPGYWPIGDYEGYVQPPVIAGHEFVGKVVALGEGAGGKYNLALGDTAVSEQITPCWECRFCKRGQYWMCHTPEIYGFRKKAQGAMAEFMRFPANAINHKIPDNVPIDHAVYIEPLSCAIHAVERGNIQFEDTVVIAGAGPIGLGMIAAAKLKSPRQLIVTDLNDHRLEIAKKAGADIVLNAGKTDVIDEVRKLTEGYGCDVFIEASGSGIAVEQGLEMIRNLGTFVVFGVFKKPVTVDWSVIGDRKELDIKGAHLGPYCYPIAIDMLAKGLLPMDEIISDTLALEDYQHGFDMVTSGAGSVKVALKPRL